MNKILLRRLHVPFSLVLMLCTLYVPSVVTGERNEPVISGWDMPQLMELMAQVPSTEETFTEKKTMAILTEPLILSGTLSYTRPDRIEKHVRSPYDERITVEGRTLTLINKDGKKTIAVRSHPVIWSFVEAIRATLAGDVAALRRFYHVKLEGDRGQWTLTLRPFDRQAAEYVRLIKFTGAENHVMRMYIEEIGGDRSVMTIREKAS